MHDNIVVAVAQESWAEAGKDILPIWAKDHAAETVDSTCDPLLRVNPNLALLETLDQAGTLAVFTARHNKTLIGYAATILCPDFSCAHLLLCNIMIYYIDPRYRGRGIGKWLFAHLEAYAVIHKAHGLMAGNKAHLPHGNALEKFGYHPYGTTYIKWVDSHETQA